VVSHRLGRVGEVLPPVAAVLFPVLFIPTLTDTYVLPRASLAVADGCLLAGWGLAASGPGLSGLDRAAFAVAATAWSHSIGCPKINPQVWDAIRDFRSTWVDHAPENFPPN
jgi:hypothetical protein